MVSDYQHNDTKIYVSPEYEGRVGSFMVLKAQESRTFSGFKDTIV